MAKIITKSGKQGEVENGSEIRECCERLGVKFNCRDGICGTCMIDVVKGEDNLSDLNQREKSMGLNKKERLACQCKIKNKDVVIDF